MLKIREHEKKEAVFSRPRSFRFDNNISDFRDYRYWPSNNIYYTKQKCPDIRALIFPHISNNIKSAISFDEYNYLHYYANNKICNHNITLLHKSECFIRERLSKEVHPLAKVYYNCYFIYHNLLLSKYHNNS